MDADRKDALKQDIAAVVEKAAKETEERAIQELLARELEEAEAPADYMPEAVQRVFVGQERLKWAQTLAAQKIRYGVAQVANCEVEKADAKQIIEQCVRALRYLDTTYPWAKAAQEELAVELERARKNIRGDGR